MRKLLVFIGIVTLLAGCDLIGNTKDDSSSKESSSLIKAGDESVSKTAAATTSEVNSHEEKPTKEALSFVPQADEINKGLTVENDEVLSTLQQMVEEDQGMGFDDDVTIIYSGQTFGKSPNLSGVFLIVNRTEIPMKNMEFTYTFGGIDRKLIFDKKAFRLTEENFGVLEPNTVMPMYLSIPSESEAAFAALDAKQVIEEINAFSYDLADSSSDSSETTDQNQLFLKLPKQNSDKGQTIDNNPLMAEFNQLVSDNPEMGFENDVTVLYSQLYDKTDNGVLAYFLVINKTTVTMEDISFIFSYGNKNNEMVWDQEPYTMTKELFGVLEPNTVIPMTLSIPADKENLFFSITEENVQTSVDKFNYQIVK